MHHGALVIRTRRPIDHLASRLALPYFCVLPAGIPTPPGGHLDYFAGSHVAAGKRLGCRTNPAHLPALDLATLCVAPPNA